MDRSPSARAVTRTLARHRDVVEAYFGPLDGVPVGRDRQASVDEPVQ